MFNREPTRGYEDEESSYGGRYRRLLFWRDELRHRRPKRVRGCVEGEGRLRSHCRVAAQQRPHEGKE